MQAGKLKVFKSSAGSGKTYTLAKEYLKIALAHSEVKEEGTDSFFRHILAITFTNDAANEMKDRVIKFLRELSLSEGSDLANELLKEIKTDYPEIQIDPRLLKSKSERILKSILHRYADFNIQTIDSFTNQMSRSFTRELGIPGNYEITLDTDEKIEPLLILLLESINKQEKSLVKWLYEYLEDLIADDKSWNISFALKEFGKKLVDETKFDVIESIRKLNLDRFSQIKSRLYARRGKIQVSISDQVKELKNYLDKENIQADDLVGKSSGLWKLLSDYELAPLRIPKDLDKPEGHRKHINKCIESGNWFRKESKISSERKLQIADSLNIKVQALILAIDEALPDIILISKILSKLYLLGLLGKISQTLDDLKLSEEQYFLSDLNERIRDIVLQEPVPFIYEKAGAKYHHILIDEFQDTSLFQWINLLPLLANSVSQGNVSLIVGDAKQSIYRFRGGDPQFLVDLPEIPLASKNPSLIDHASALQNQVEISVLDRNWRSASELVEFNNSFFNWMKKENTELPGLKGFYDDVEQVAQKKLASEIRVDKVVSETGIIQNIQDSKYTLMIEYINQAVNQKGFLLRDIAVLVPKNSHVNELSKELMNAGINIISDESLLLRNSWTVQLILTAFKFLESPEDQEVRFRFITNLSRISITQNLNWELLKEKLKNVGGPEFLAFLIDYFQIDADVEALRSGRLYEIAQAWINGAKLESDKKEQVYQDFFLDVLHNFQKSETDINSFLKYWESKEDKLSISSSKSQNAVRVMTIHKSKGLEFPLVIIPFPEISYVPQATSEIWSKLDEAYEEFDALVVAYSKALKKTVLEKNTRKFEEDEYIDRLNGLYVAMTRAINCMYIISSNYKSKNHFHNYINSFIEHNYSLIKEEKESINTSYEHYLIKKFELEDDRKLEDIKFPLIDNSKIKRTKLGKRLRWNRDLGSESLLRSIDKGKLIHNCLSQLESFHELEFVIKKYEKMAFEYEVDLKELINKILKDPTLKPLYDGNWKVYNERDILGFDSKNRPDRVQIKNDEIVIIDYKTGKKEDKHKNQIREYCAILNKVYPEKSFQNILVYLEPLEVLVVD